MDFTGYFQIVIIAVIPIIIATKAIYLRVTTGINPIVIGRAAEGVWRVVELFALATLILWMVEIFLHALHSLLDLFPERVEVAWLHAQPVRILGAVFAGSGLIIFILAFFSFGDSWRIGIDRKTAGGLVTGGIFSITRNPIYVAFNLLFIGVFLMNGTWFFLIFALLGGVAVHTQILREEKFLTQLYDEKYQHYRQKTPRYLIW